MTPLGTEGGIHDVVSCTTCGDADRFDTRPGAVQEHMLTLLYNMNMQWSSIHSPSCSVSTVNHWIVQSLHHWLAQSSWWMESMALRYARDIPLHRSLVVYTKKNIFRFRESRMWQPSHIGRKKDATYKMCKVQLYIVSMQATGTIYLTHSWMSVQWRV